MCVHVTLFMLQCWVPSGPPQGGRGWPEPRHRCHSAPAASSEGVPGGQAGDGSELSKDRAPQNRKQTRHPDLPEGPVEVQRGENSEVQKVSSDVKQIKLSAGHSGPFQADLTATPVPSLCHTGILAPKPWAGAGDTQSHTRVCRGLPDPRRRNRVGSHRKGTDALPSLTEPVCMGVPQRKA